MRAGQRCAIEQCERMFIRRPVKAAKIIGMTNFKLTLRRLLVACWWIFCAHIVAGPALAATPDDDFLAARDAFRAGDAARFERAAKSLADYPLEPYIAYWRLRLRLEQATADDVQALLARAKDSPVVNSLRADWLKLLANRQQWDMFDAEYPQFVGDDPELLSEKAPLIISGHFHLRDEKEIGKSMIVYTGNPFQMDFGDVQQRKGYYLLDIKSSEYEFIENNLTTKHIIVYLSKLIKLKDADEVFKSFIPNNIIKLTIDRNISTDDLDVLVMKMQSYRPNDLHVDHDVNYNKIKVKEDNNVDLSGVDITHAIEEFVRLLDINNKKEVIDYTIDLFNRSKK